MRDDPGAIAEIHCDGLSDHPVGPERPRDDDEQMPRWAKGQRPSVGCELGPDRSDVLGAFVDLERQDGGACVCGHDGDAVGSDEPAEDVRCHRIGEPELDGWPFAIACAVEGADGPGGVDAVAHVRRRGCRTSGSETLVDERAESVCEIGTTWRLSG